MTDRVTAQDAQDFGPYRLIRLLGGGVGLVYLAHQPSLDRLVALKIIRHERIDDADARERFAREARAAARLHLPGICPVFDVGEVDGVPYISMRYVDGETLAAKVSAARSARGFGPIDLAPGPAAHRSALPPGLATLLELFAEIGDTLHAAHEHRILHRDVKPSNVIVSAAGEPMLLDFGLARDDSAELRRLTMTGQIVGTPAYMAPERIAGRGAGADRRSDVYSLAATLFECLALRPPFEAPSRERLFREILGEPAPDVRAFVPGLPADLSVVLEVGLSKPVGERYATAAEFSADLRRIARGDPIRARRPGRLHRVRSWTLRNPAIALLLLGLGAAVGIAAAAVPVVAAEREIAADNDADLRLCALRGHLQRARREAAELIPPWPENVTRIQQWLREFGHPLRDARPALQSRLAARANAPADRPVPRFLTGALQALVADLDPFVAQDLADVERRLDWATTIATRSIEAHEKAWTECAAAIARRPDYRPLALRPQMGLVPLGPDPVSGLFEFYHLASAHRDAPRPVRDRHGRLDLDERHGIVFVLLPAASRAPLGRQQTVELDAFLIGKHEVTRAQWARLTGGARPSRWQTGTRVRGELQTDSRPVDMVRWSDADAVLRGVGLCLPTEVQWEYASLAGSSTSWHCGDRPSDVEGFANVLDRSVLRFDSTGGAAYPYAAPFDDGYVKTAPIGSYAPNAFGLHDTIGNVAEWCADSHEWSEPRNGDGLHVLPPATYPEVVFRGASHRSGLLPTATRHPLLPEAARDSVGLRAARALR